jgi:spore maturation protein CgeB
MMTPLRIAWFGSSLVSAYWNGAATYYRGIIRALADRGHQVEFFEPDAFERQAHRDMDDPDWARVTCFEPTEPAAAACLERARRADVIIKSSGIGVLDGYLEREIALARGFSTQTVLWDVDAPATLASLAANPDAPLRRHVGDYDWVLTYGGGPPVVAAYEALGVRRCIPIYNALDASTHYRVPPRDEFAADLSFLANRLPDRENRVREFFFDPIKRLPGKRFLLGGSGWESSDLQAPNLRRIGHVYTRDHNVFNSSALAVLNVCRDSMASTGYSPATRVFEAAGAGACIISDAWTGIEQFLEPGREVLVAGNGAEVAEHLSALTPRRARLIGWAARRRVLEQHTYDARARIVEVLLGAGREPSAPERATWTGVPAQEASP